VSILNLTPALVKSDLDLTAFTLVPVKPAAPVDPWVAENVALYLTGLALDLIEDGLAYETDMSDEVDLLWINLEPENKADFHAFLEMTESPADSWSTWIALVIEGTPVEFDAPAPIISEAYRPTALETYNPTPAETAEYLAMLADDEAREDIMEEFAVADRAEAMEAAFGDPWDMIAYEELAECRGYHPSQAYDL
jgi:hypothetical protein